MLLETFYEDWISNLRVEVHKGFKSIAIFGWDSFLMHFNMLIKTALNFMKFPYSFTMLKNMYPTEYVKSLLTGPHNGRINKHKNM